MPLYNCEHFVIDAVSSVIEQTYKNWELIIVDDKSTDDSYILTQEFIKRDSRVHLHQMVFNSGASATRNYAIKLAKGTYIAFLDSDDLWKSNKLETQILFMQKNNVYLSYTAYQWINEKEEVLKDKITAADQVDYKKLLKKNTIGCLTAVYDCSKIGKFYFNTSLNKQEDYQYWLEILKTIPSAKGIDISLGYYRIRQNSLSSNKIIAATYVWKILREYQKIPLLKAIYYFGYYAVNSVLKYYSK